MVLGTSAGILSILATIFGSAMSLAYFPQAYKIHKRKSSEDISLLTFSVFLVGVVVWLLYGLSIQNFPVVFANFLGLLGVSSVIFMCVRYKKLKQ